MKPEHVDRQDKNLNALRALSRLSQRVSTGFLLVILLLLALFIFAITHSLATTGRAPAGWVINWIPALFYGWALWALRKLFADLAGLALDSRWGAEVCGRIAAAWSGIGWALMLGAVSTLVPLVNFFLAPAARGGNIVVFLVPALTLFTVGLAMTLLTHLSQRAVALETEAKTLRDELAGFV
jgi:hypothetical protein